MVKIVNFLAEHSLVCILCSSLLITNKLTNIQEMLDSGAKDWQYVIGPPVMSGISVLMSFIQVFKSVHIKTLHPAV